MSEWSFITHITDYMARPRLGDSKPPTLWPSEASAVLVNEYDEEHVVGKCRRASYFRLLLDSYDYFEDKYSFYKPIVEALHLEKIPVEPYVRWLWKQGDLYEQFCIDIAKNSGTYIADQVQVYIPELNISGKIDIIVIDPTTKQLRIVECKSIYGYNENTILGTPAERKRGKLGTPRESYLMQLGIYQYWTGAKEEYGDALLVTGARDTGRYAEFNLVVKQDESIEDDNSNYIFYSGNSPCQTEEVNSGISIENIFEQYQSTTKCLDSGTIPKRDFELQFSQDKIDKLYDRGLLSKKDTEQHRKRKEQIAAGKARPVKAVDKGDWQCRLCAYKNICYQEDNTPRDL